MKISNWVSFAALSFNGLLLLILGARIWSAPDVFTDTLGLMPTTQAVIDSLSANHGGALVALGATALASAFSPRRWRWVALLVLTTLGVAAHVWMWRFEAQASDLYRPLLNALFAFNVVSLFAAFVVPRVNALSHSTRSESEKSCSINPAHPT